MGDGKVNQAARFGLVARGVLYALVGVLVFQIADGPGGGREADTQGALKTVAQQPLGTALLALLALGFVVYAVWQLRCAWLADETRDRLAALGRGVLWLVFAVSAARIVFGAAGGMGEESVTARVLGAPFGPWLVGLAGVATVVVALSFLRHLRGRSYLEDLRPLPATTRRAVSVAATVGIAAKTAVTVLVGVFLVRAALRHDPDSGVGLDGALSQIARQPYGAYVLVTCACGLLAYALWCGLRARYEDVHRSDG